MGRCRGEGEVECETGADRGSGGGAEDGRGGGEERSGERFLPGDFPLPCAFRSAAGDLVLPAIAI